MPTKSKRTRGRNAVQRVDNSSSAAKTVIWVREVYDRIVKFIKFHLIFTISVVLLGVIAIGGFYFMNAYRRESTTNAPLPSNWKTNTDDEGAAERKLRIVYRVIEHFTGIDEDFIVLLVRGWKYVLKRFRTETPSESAPTAGVGSVRPTGLIVCWTMLIHLTVGSLFLFH